MMSEAVFLIDLASARPPQPPSARFWPLIAKEHCNFLKRCILRIVTHSEATAVTTHVFDSSVLVQSGGPSKMPIREALDDLERIVEQVIKLDITGAKHPTARGIVAGISDGAPEDSFSDYYDNSESNPDIYIFARAPSTKSALAAFLGCEEFDIAALEQKLNSSPYLPNKLRELAKRGYRVAWVNSTPRRCELVDNAHYEVEQAFSKWLLSYSPKFRFLNLHSFLLDRRIVPAKAMQRSLWYDPPSHLTSPGTVVEVMCLEDSQLLRCFQANINMFHGYAANQDSQLTLVLSGIARNYDTMELTALGAFKTPASLLTPSATHYLDKGSRPWPSSIFAGLMVDLVRQNACLIADLIEVNAEKESFIRYQTILQPVTPITGVLRRISRVTSAVNYSAPSLPESFEEWMDWDPRGNIRDCDMADSAILASAKFFETYLPTLFPAQRKENEVFQLAGGEMNISELASVPPEKMLSSFEDNVPTFAGAGQQALSALVEGIFTDPIARSNDSAFKKELTYRPLILEQLRSQLEEERKRKEQLSPKLSSPNRHLPRQVLHRHGSPRQTHTFKWRTGSSKTTAPQENDIQRCMEAHMYDRKQEKNPNYTCVNLQKECHAEAAAMPKIIRNDHATDQSHVSVVQQTKQVTSPDRTNCRTAVSPYVSCASGEANSNRNGFALVDGKTANVPLNRTVSNNFGSTDVRALTSPQHKRKADALGIEEGQVRKRNQLANLKSVTKEQDSTCEKEHGREIRQSITLCSVTMRKLREVSSNRMEETLWRCIDHLSALSKALSVNHGERCDVDRIINLNLKIPKAVTAAVQEVQNKLKRDEISSKAVICEIWETIICAFEQCVWHLASSRRIAMNEEGKPSFRRQVRQVATILTCTQFMAETAANTRPQPVSFRRMFSKLFSSVFIHLGALESGKPFSEVVNLFEKFEEQLPTSLQMQKSSVIEEKAQDGDGQQEQSSGDTGKSRSPHLATPRINAGEGIPEQIKSSTKLPLRSKVEGDRSSKSEPPTAAWHRCNRTIALARPQFAKESEALRNAMMSQTRLAVMVSKKGQRQSLPFRGRKRSTSIDVSGSSLQAILANTVPAPVIDDPTPECESTKEQVLLPQQSEGSMKQMQNGVGAKKRVASDGITTFGVDSQEDKTGLVQPTTAEDAPGMDKSPFPKDRIVFSSIEHSAVEDTPNLKEGELQYTVPSSGQSDPEDIGTCAESRAQQCAKVHVEPESSNCRQSYTTAPVLSANSPNRSKVRTNLVYTSGSRPDEGDCGSTSGPIDTLTEVPLRENDRRRRKAREGKMHGTEKAPVGGSSRCVTRSKAKQNLAKAIKASTLFEPAQGTHRPLTRSQAKTTATKRRTNALEPRKDGSPSHSSRKRRRTKEVCVDPKVHPQASSIPDCEALPKSSSPITRSQAKAIEAEGSIQLRNRCISCPTRTVGVTPEVRQVSVDLGTPLKTAAPRIAMDGISSFGEEIRTPLTPRLRLQRDVFIPQTPAAYDSVNKESSAIRKIAESSLERRRKQLEEVNFIPETPIAPKPSRIQHPLRKAVNRSLFSRKPLN